MDKGKGVDCILYFLLCVEILELDRMSLLVLFVSPGPGLEAAIFRANLLSILNKLSHTRVENRQLEEEYRPSRQVDSSQSSQEPPPPKIVPFQSITNLKD